MIKKAIRNIIKRRHFWRDAGFDELSELYISMIFRSVAVGSIGVFVPMYLYLLGHSITDIFMVYAWFATFAAAASMFVARLVARFGPKHIILVSYVFQLASSILFLTHGDHPWPLFVLGGLWGIATNLFFVPYHVDFSKVKHVNHSGKELSYMLVMQKVGLTAGPLIGGIVAAAFGSQYVFLIAAFLMAIGALPLLMSGEPVRTHQKLDFSMPVDKVKRGLASYASWASADILYKAAWPAYVGIFVLSKDIFLKLGVLSSASVAVSVVVTIIFGKMADKNRGRQMIRRATLFASLVELIRPFVTTFAQTIGLNVMYDAAKVGYTLPYVKGLYASADELPGHRIAYIGAIEAFGNIARAFVCWLLVIVSLSFTVYTTLTTGFVLAAIAVLGVSLERFKALDKGAQTE